MEYSKYEKTDLNLERKRLIQAARELRYPVVVIDKLQAAKTSTEMYSIMVNARKRMYG